MSLLVQKFLKSNDWVEIPEATDHSTPKEYLPISFREKFLKYARRLFTCILIGEKSHSEFQKGYNYA